MEPEEASEEVVGAVASGLWISQLLVMKWAAVDLTETGVLVGMLGGDVVEKVEVEVVGRFVRDEVEVDVLKLSPWLPGKGHELEVGQCASV